MKKENPEKEVFNNTPKEIQRRAFFGKVPTGGVRLTRAERKEFEAYKRGSSAYATGETDVLGNLKSFAVRFQPRIIQ